MVTVFDSVCACFPFKTAAFMFKGKGIYYGDPLVQGKGSAKNGQYDKGIRLSGTPIFLLQVCIR